MSHTTNKEAVASWKVVGITEAEALAAVLSLRQLAEDSETNQGVKGEAINHARTLQMNAGNAQAREETMRRAVAMAGRA